MNAREFGDWLKGIRLGLGLTQEEMAKSILIKTADDKEAKPLSKATLCKYEKGETLPKKWFEIKTTILETHKEELERRGLLVK